ncbi:hypothetical protein K2173_006384 [Erythroxylum novogranatense]|uniref:Alpha-amylase n=1 Tax=Erythroxylum novogranatense TaxID=1862640 RepID=A0AAV8U6B2_9ROSI|nr:hypothetical protein K2173_006384 [Erythroxylum novogranatense]
MSTVAIEPLLRYSRRERAGFRCRPKIPSPCSVNFCSLTKLSPVLASFCSLRLSSTTHAVRASSSADTALAETLEGSTSDGVCFRETFRLPRTETVEGKIFVRLDQASDQKNWQLTVGCSLPGKWILHWGVTYVDDNGSEWDQPPNNMRPPGSIAIKDYAIETPLKKPSEGDIFHEVMINVDSNSSIAVINFVLKDEETGTCYQHKGRDFKVPLVDYLVHDSNVVEAKWGFNIWPGALLSNIFHKAEALPSKNEDNNSESKDFKQGSRQLEAFYEEQPIAKHIAIANSVTVSVRKCPNTAKFLLYLETDLPEVVVHWGVCRGDDKNWEIPPAPHPPGTTLYKNKALRTLLQRKEDGNGCSGSFTLDEELMGFLFVLKLGENNWLKPERNYFFIPLSSSNSLTAQTAQPRPKAPVSALVSGEAAESNQENSRTADTDGSIDEIRNLAGEVSSQSGGKAKTKKTQESGGKAKTKTTQESILQEIEKLAAEAYNFFKSSIATLSKETTLKPEELKAPPKVAPGTGTGYEILLQGFNWESHKSRRWYLELKEKATEIASLGFTVIWLPPPTESVSPEGYMPKDLYNLNSRYGNIDQLKDLVRNLHDVNIKVLGDVVLNHRCAHYQNQNGVWNIFGGRLKWDDRAIVADDPHFQGRGNKSSGDIFHAAPNIDHSQDFVRKDIKEWLNWLRKEIGYDGWRLDFARGFWGGYVKDYLDASEPYFVVGEYWDSLGYTYGEMNYNQDAHRQRIIDWINATGGIAGAFDITTKGILHSVLERCEYWRLSDQKGKPPGVVGWWPSRAVTFIENHDTGSTQGHWRFPGGKEMEGYAYILTHPGTPAVFFDHIFSHHRSEISALIALRKRNKIHCRSKVSAIHLFLF